jgi:hypothetical protein
MSLLTSSVELHEKKDASSTKTAGKTGWQSAKN